MKMMFACFFQFHRSFSIFISGEAITVEDGKFLWDTEAGTSLKK